MTDLSTSTVTHPAASTNSTSLSSTDDDENKNELSRTEEVMLKHMFDQHGCPECTASMQDKKTKKGYIQAVKLRINQILTSDEKGRYYHHHQFFNLKHDLDRELHYDDTLKSIRRFQLEWDWMSPTYQGVFAFCFIYNTKNRPIDRKEKREDAKWYTMADLLKAPFDDDHPYFKLSHRMHQYRDSTTGQENINPEITDLYLLSLWVQSAICTQQMLDTNQTPTSQ